MLVAVYNVAWLLCCRGKGISDFDNMIPGCFKQYLPCRHGRLTCVLLVTYGSLVEQALESVEAGYSVLKIGNDPDIDDSFDKMLAWDKRRLTDIHETVKDMKTGDTDCGHVVYYPDGRYDSKYRALRLLDHADGIGALERIILLEEIRRIFH